MHEVRTLGRLALVLGALAAGGCGVPRMEHARALNALAAERAARAEELDRRAAAERELAECTGEGPEEAGGAPASRPSLDELEREIELLRRRVEDLRRLGDPAGPPVGPDASPSSAPSLAPAPGKGKP